MPSRRRGLAAHTKLRGDLPVWHGKCYYLLFVWLA